MRIQEISVRSPSGPSVLVLWQQNLPHLLEYLPAYYISLFCTDLDT
jgi:hypothetical protein